ncbi:MAG TPA: MBL fold metallo-hydrolase [Bacteroidales bacterium]|nr:MBL fold metallo-hydrolase [Bacteroidales bacterium]HQI44785.1 MBL fold metallo-hydrolase [Bacteroidales bacterium]
MEITFLGTGTSQGVPVISCNCDICKSKDSKDQRLRSSIFIQTENNAILIDAGPDFRQQMLREHISNLDAILITHGHKDHLGGLDDIRAFNYSQKRAMDIYAQENVNNEIIKGYSYAFEEQKYPGVPEMNLRTIHNSPFIINKDTITPIEVMHHHLPVLGYRIKDFTYITDANYIKETEIQKIEGSKIIVLNALRKKKHLSHFNLDEAVALLIKLKPEQAYLTHISHLMGFHKEIEKELPSFIKLAYDGLKFFV